MSKNLISKIKKLGILFTVLIWLTSCSSYRYLYYVPTPNNPTFQKKGQSMLSAEVEGTAFSNTESIGGAFQGAYAINNHWATGYHFDYREEKNIYRNTSFTSNRNNYYDSSYVLTNRNAHEISIGYFTPVNKIKTDFFSIYSGYGYGLIHMRESGADSSLNPYQRDLQATIHKFFIQPAFYIIPNKNISLAFVTKFSGFYYCFNNNSYSTGEKVYYKMNINNNDFFIDLEPTIFFSFGIKNAHLFTSYTFSSPIYGKPIDVISSCFSFGTKVDLISILKHR